jgi:ribosomal protein L11 methyltransferase
MPKMSFGTGHHATTYLVAEALLALDVENLHVLDMGCGTGILAILAAMKNAASVDAIDIDDWAYENAVENIAANNVAQKVNVILGDVAKIQGKTYDLIIANINRNIILDDLKYYSQSLKNGGRLIVSGILTEDIEIVESEAKKYNLKKIEEKTRNKWARIQFIS